MNQVSKIPEIVNEEPLLRSIVECMSEKLQAKVHEIPDDIRTMPITELEDRNSITVVMRQIKVSLWKNYRRALDENRNKIEMSEVYKFICARSYFYEYMVDREEIFAWLLHPPQDYEAAVEEALAFGVERVREMLTAPLFHEKEDGTKGQFNKDNAAVVLNAVKFLDARVKGTPLQRIKNENTNLNLHMHKHEATKGVTKEDLEQELLELQARLSGQPLQIKAPDDPE